jgi:hypothetical protein
LFFFLRRKSFDFSDGEEDEDDEGISERSLRRTPSDDGKQMFCLKIKIFWFLQIFKAHKIPTIALKILI